MVETGIRVTVEDIATGDMESTVVHDGQHVLICVEPAYKSAVQVYANGTTQITIRQRSVKSPRTVR